MKCLNCDANIPDSSKFCPYCGVVVRPDLIHRVDKEIIKDPDFSEADNSEPGYAPVINRKSNPGCLVLIIGTIIIGLTILITASSMASWKFERLTGVWILSFGLLILISVLLNSNARKRNNI
jgi:uncharacterized integral membrane protein